MLNRTTRTVGAVLSLVVASLVLWGSPAPSGAQIVPRSDDPPINEDGNDVVGNIRSQVNTLNSGSPGSGGPPPSCTWTETRPNGETVERTDGTPQWRAPGQGHEFWAEGWEESEGQVVGNGLIFRYECWHPDMGCRTPAPSGEGCLGEAIQETFCGSFLCLFDAVNPPNLARLAVDGFVESLGDPIPRFSPGGPTLVNFETYMWLTNAPPGGVVPLPPMQVPGLTVTATATASDITWEMGDGQSVTCPITRDEASAAAADCSYSYGSSSARQPDLKYQGTVSMTFDVQWQASGAGSISGSLEALRSSPFALGVNEAQAINTRPGG